MFADPCRIERYDEQHSINESRYITIGCISDVLTVVTVVYTERVNHIRIISARKATKFEREVYNDARRKGY